VPAPTTTKKDLSKLFSPVQQTLIQAPPPPQEQTKTDWVIVTLNTEQQDLAHTSDNPYDFLPTNKLGKLIDFWQDKKGAESIRKVLVKVVSVGAHLIEDDKKIAWIQAAITSVVTQCDPTPDILAKSPMALDPAKPGYSWIIVPVGVAAFKALEEVCAALDPKSGTLVLFPIWEDGLFPPQQLYAMCDKMQGLPFTS